jgi:hypothetical protein
MNPQKQLQETPRPRGDRIAASELERRIQDVVRLVEEGCPRSEILAHCERQYGASRSTADRYIEKANEYFKEVYKPQLKRSAEIAKRRYETIFHRAMKKEYYRVALGAQTQLSRIQGLCDDDLMARIRVESTRPGGSF